MLSCTRFSDDTKCTPRIKAKAKNRNGPWLMTRFWKDRRERKVRFVYLVLVSVFFASVLVLAAVLPLGASSPSMLVAIILYLIMTLSPFLISPLVLVSLSRAISQLSLPFLTIIASSLTSTTG